MIMKYWILSGNNKIPGNVDFSDDLGGQKHEQENNDR